MRLHLLALAAALIAAPSVAGTRSYTVTGFERIRVEGPYQVSLKTGVSPFASATGSTDALDALSLDVEGRTLVIRRKASNKSKAATGLVTISVGTHELGQASLSGSGGLAIDGVKGHAFQLSVAGSGAAEIGKVSVDRLRVSLSGSAAAVLGGNAQEASFSLRGTSSLQALDLSAKAATIAATGPSTVRVTATNTAKVTAAGLATVELAGAPACSVQPTSTAEVHGCR